MKSNVFKSALVAALISWGSMGFAELIVTKSAFPPEDKKQGYIENSPVTFEVTSGQSPATARTAKGAPANKTMRRVVLGINGRTIVVQNGADNVLYVKGQDEHGSIVTLRDGDYAAIKEAFANLANIRKGDNANELHEAVGTALSLLGSWPKAMPVLIWQDGKQKITAVDADTVVSETPNAEIGGVSKNAPKKVPIDKAILLQPDITLHLPEIEPLQPVPLSGVAPTANAIPSNVTAEAVGAASSDSSISLCSKMGVTMPGSYPLISVTIFPPSIDVVGTDSYKAAVGGVQCLARCGGGCVDSVAGVSGFGKNAYSQDCLDHDMCVGKRGNDSYCNLIFSDAANDFFQTPCGHDLILQNVVVSNNPLATSQLPTLSSKSSLYVVFTVKNNANTRLPHNRVYFDVLVDGKRKARVRLAKVLNAFDAARYYYQIGNATTNKAGKHSVSLQIISTELIQTNTNNDVAKRAFSLI